MDLSSLSDFLLKPYTDNLGEQTVSFIGKEDNYFCFITARQNQTFYVIILIIYLFLDSLVTRLAAYFAKQMQFSTGMNYVSN